MKGTLQIAQFFGIPVFLHWTFALMFVYVPWIGYREGLNPQQTLWLALLITATFACVLLHEYGHALAARRYGIHTQDIILLPIGGVARLTRLPDQPLQELVVAIAGPLVNVFIAIVLGIWLVFSNFSLLSEELLTESTLIGDYRFFIPSLIFVNITLVIFNLIPAFPMDGGRILRALLSWKLGLYKATRIATFLGQILAALLFIWGIHENSYTTSLIGIFVFLSAARESKIIARTTLPTRTEVSKLISEKFGHLSSTDTIHTAMKCLEKNDVRHFVVTDEEERVAGILTEHCLLSAFFLGTGELPVKTLLQKVPEMAAHDSIALAHSYMNEYNVPFLPVTTGGKPIGIIEKTAIENMMHS